MPSKHGEVVQELGAEGQGRQAQGGRRGRKAALGALAAAAQAAPAAAEWQWCRHQAHQEKRQWWPSSHGSGAAETVAVTMAVAAVGGGDVVAPPLVLQLESLGTRPGVCRVPHLYSVPFHSPPKPRGPRGSLFIGRDKTTGKCSTAQAPAVIRMTVTVMLVEPQRY